MMDKFIGKTLINIHNEYKNKIITDVLYSKNNTCIIVYKFWNQVGNIEKASTLNKLLENHNIKDNNE